MVASDQARAGQINLQEVAIVHHEKPLLFLEFRSNNV